jgi:flagellar motor switch protein FliG
MEIYARRTKQDELLLTIGYVSFDLPEEALKKLTNIIATRLNQSSTMDNANLQKKITAYKKLVNKLALANDRVVQEFAISLTTEQLVTLARLADGEDMLNKIIKNLSRQNSKQFQDDFNKMTGITEQQAIINMEMAVPIIREIANKLS